MISMSNVTSVGAAGSYYASDNYYSRDENQVQSVWQGHGAEVLGLSGMVEPEAFKQVLSGEVGEQRLGRVTGTGPDGELQREHRPGYDVTLSAPKSVSILAEVGGCTDVRAAHEAATSKVLEYIERNLIGSRVTENGETRFVQTDNLIAGRFHHTTSRDLDPQTHTHLVIANATQTPDGVWRSLSNEQIYKSQALLGVIYDSELAANLRDRGYRLEATDNGKWEVAGINREQIEHFSQRSRAIDARLEKFGLTRETATAEQRENAALNTRVSKKAVDHVALRETWVERAGAVGIDFAKIEADRAVLAAQPQDPTLSPDKAAAAVRFAIEHLTEREAVVSRESVAMAAVAHSIRDSVWAGVRLEHIDAAIGHQLADKSALEAGVDREGRLMLTTPLAIDREQAMVAMLEAGRGASTAVAKPTLVDSAIERFEAGKSAALGVDFKLTTGQYDAAMLTLTSEDRFVGLQGYAGVGKTTMMELVKDVAVQAGYTLRGMASSAEAAATLAKETGIESTTTARFLLDEGRRAMEPAKPAEINFFAALDYAGREYGSVTVAMPHGSTATSQRKELWILDEASLAGQRELTTVMSLAERAGAKVAFSGDKLQLNAVEAGKPFEMLLQRGIASAEMTEINRQRQEDLKQAVAAAVARNNAKAFALLSKRIVEISDKGDLFARIATDILAKPTERRNESLLIVPLNTDRQAINIQVREGLQARGEIAMDQVGRAVLVASGFTDAQKASAPYYEAGMVVRFGRDYSRSLGVESGDYASVVGVDRKMNLVTLMAEDGRRFEWSPSKQSKVEVYAREVREVAVGDELRFTKNDRGLGVNNGTLAKVTAMGSSEVVLSTKTGELRLNSEQLAHGHWDYAYAMTVYASQGKTVSTSNLLITADSGQAMGERSFLVGVTRERDDLAIYTDSRKKAVDLITTSQDKTSAIEALEGRAAPPSSKPGKGATAGGSAPKGAEIEL